MEFHKNQLRLYAITNRALTCPKTLFEHTKDALKGGVTMLQLREKNLDEQAFIKEAIQMKELCHSYQVPLIINDNVTVALKSGADGVHVGIHDMPVWKIRKQAGSHFIIGATAKTVQQAKQAEAEGADYIGTGAVFLSPTKKNAIRITKEMLCEICSCVSIPTIAVGGVNKNNLSYLRGTGISGIAVVSAIYEASDAAEAAKSLKEIISMQINGMAEQSGV